MRRALLYLANTCGVGLMMIASMISDPMRTIFLTVGVLMSTISCAILYVEDNHGTQRRNLHYEMSY